LFLDKLGLSPLKQVFIDHKVTGHVLMVRVCFKRARTVSSCG
jgi:hypothetical protein